MIFSLEACSSQRTPAAAIPESAPASESPSRASECRPLEARPANAPDQQPAFAGQTRTCGVTSNVAFQVTVLARGLVHPWAVEPLPDGGFLITERPGRLRLVSASGELGEPVTGLPPVDARGQGGLLDVAVSPSFAGDRTIYWSYAKPRDGGNATSVARGVLAADRRSVGSVQVIFRAQPTYDGTMHFGSRLAFAPDGNLFITLGERSDTPMRPQAQQPGSHMGKIVRINPDGSVPDDNPLAGRPGALPEIWTLGHRNVQGAAFDGQGRLWAIEHGARGGDALSASATMSPHASAVPEAAPGPHGRGPNVRDSDHRTNRRLALASETPLVSLVRVAPASGGTRDMRMHAITALALLGAAACSRGATVEGYEAPAPAAAEAPATSASLPEGSTIHARLDDSIGTDRNKVGDRFTATVTQAVTAQNGATVVPVGAKVHGTVTGLEDSDRAGENAFIRLDFETLTINGRDYAFDADVVATAVETEGDSRNETLKKAGIGAAAGAVLGAVIGDADLKNILAGAAIGAAAGTVISMGASDVEAVLPAGSELTLRSTEMVSLR